MISCTNCGICFRNIIFRWLRSHILRLLDYAIDDCWLSEHLLVPFLKYVIRYAI